MKCVVLSSTVPDPRMLKRIRSLKKLFSEIYLFFWSRTHGNGSVYNEIQGVHHFEILSTDTPNLIHRFFENKKLIRKTIDIVMENVKDISLIYVNGVEMLEVAKCVRKKTCTQIILEIADIPANTHIERLGIFGKILESEINKLVLDENLFYVFTSPGYINYYQKYGINSEKVFIFENCPESRLFSSHDWSNNIIQKERITVGYIGAVAYYKSLKTLMKAASNMNEVEVFIAGKGPQSELIKREAKKYPNVFVYGHYDYEKEIVDLYKRVDIVYSVYNTDNFNVRLALPNKLYEAIVTGRPIIVSKGTYLERYVNELGIGFAVRYKDFHELKDLLSKISKDREILKEASNNCLRVAGKYYYEEYEASFIKWISRKVLSNP